MRLLLVSFVLSAAFFCSEAARADSVAFTIFKEGEAIGHDIYTIDKDGDTTTVKVATQTDVNILFLEFHYRQDRTEIWKDGQLVSLVSDTNDDGQKHHIEVHREADSLIGVVDGANRSMGADTIPFTLWNMAFVNHTKLINVSTFELIKAAFEDKGSDQITIDGKKFDARHFLMSGDLHWDLWYDTNNMLLKSAFKRRGYPISFVRE